MSHRGLETAPFPILLCWLPKQFESPFPSWRALHLTRLAPQHLSRILRADSQVHTNHNNICKISPWKVVSFQQESKLKEISKKHQLHLPNKFYGNIIEYVCIFYIYTCVCVCSISIPVVPHKAVAEVSKIAEVSCCDAWMAERFHWWTEKWLECWPSIYPSIYLSVYPSFHLSVYLSPTDPFIRLSSFLSIYLFSCLSLCASFCVTVFFSFYFSLYVSV